MNTTMFNAIELEQIQKSGLRVMINAVDGLCDIYQKVLEPVDITEDLIGTGMDHNQTMLVVCGYNAGRDQGMSMAM